MTQLFGSGFGQKRIHLEHRRLNGSLRGSLAFEHVLAGAERHEERNEAGRHQRVAAIHRFPPRAAAVPLDTNRCSRFPSYVSPV